MSEFADQFSAKILQKVLDLEMGENDPGAGTVREYLTTLLCVVWSDAEDFDGKRPFGNSGWQSEIYDVLFQTDFVDQVDYDRAERLVLAAIEYMGRAPSETTAA